MCQARGERKRKRLEIALHHTYAEMTFRYHLGNTVQSLILTWIQVPLAMLRKKAFCNPAKATSSAMAVSYQARCSGRFLWPPATAVSICLYEVDGSPVVLPFSDKSQLNLSKQYQFSYNYR